MPRNKSFTDRILIIDECLNNKQRRWNKEKLIHAIADKIDKTTISDRTFYNDIKYLIEERNAPIVCNDGIYSYTESFSLSIPKLKTEETNNLRMAIGLLQQLDYVPHLTDIKQLIDKLEAVANTSIEDERTIVQFEHHAPLKGINKYFDILCQAIEKYIEIEIVYKKFFTEDSKSYFFMPYLLKEYKNRWYLLGIVKGKDSIITLALDRIESATITNNTFTPIEFKANTYYNNAIGITFINNPVPTIINLRVIKKQLPYFLNQPLHISQKIEKEYSNGDALISINVIINIELKLLLMQYSHTLTIVKPKSLRKELYGMLKTAIKLNECK